MRYASVVTFLMLSLTLVSCQTVRGTGPNGESAAEVKEAVKTIAESVSGQNMTEEEVDRLMSDIRTDPEAQSAVEVIKDSLSGENAGRVKYSPATGKRYAPHLEYDPETGVKLEYVE